MITVRLHGPMALHAADGRCITPQGAKVQALVALLLATPTMTRTRPWLQDKLWSDRGPEQAAASLRQAIYQLRGALGDAAGALHSDRRAVSLDPAQVRVLPPEPGQEYLEGIDVRDPEFEDWLTLQRMAEGAPPTTPSGMRPAAVPQARSFRVLLTLTGDAPEHGMLLGWMVADMFTRALEDRALAEVQTEPDDTTAPVDLRLCLTAHGGARPMLRARMVAGPGARHVWAEMIPLDAIDAEPFEQARLARFVNSGIEAVISAAAQRARAQEATAGVDATHRAARRIFGFSVADLQAAETLLMREDAQTPSGLAWRIFLRMVQRVECAAPDDRALRDEVEELVQRALRLDQGNTLVLCAAANAYLKVLDRPEEALALSHRALEGGWSNPFAHDVAANALLLQGEAEAAYRAASRARFIGQTTPMSHFFDMGLCLAAVATGRYDEALSLARQAAALAPNFRPPLRYLAILNAAADRPEAAAAALGRLRAIEPGFDPRRFTQDPAYPVAAFRHSPIADRPVLRDLR